MALWLYELEKMLDAILIAFPKVAHSTLFHKLKLSERVRVKSSCTHGWKLPPITCQRHVDTTKWTLGSIRAVTIRMAFPGTSQIAIENATYKH